MSRIDQLAADPAIEALHSKLTANLPHIIEEAITIQQISAPTFQEGQRAAYVYERFTGLADLQIDSVHNVYARLPGTNPTLPAVLLAAHTDTVFAADAILTIQRQNGRVYGPGIGDNSLGVAAVLSMADLLRQQSLESDIWFVANSREEGMGDLGGMRAVYEKLMPRLGLALILEGMAYGHIYRSGIAVRRLKITCKTGGGHSWLHYGRPSAIHTLMRIGAAITQLTPPQEPRTTFNIGVIEGGQSVNSIATTASMLLDMRSEERDTLADLEQQVRHIIDQQRIPDVEIVVEVVGDRPSGSIALTHPLVQLARDVLRWQGIHPVYETGSTDANVLLAAGLPSITIGVTHGGNAHRLDEYIETAPIRDGLWQLLLLTIAAANGLASKLGLPLR
ncbi:MAG: M20/M25/M40 family metallo-hydrolase [Chloroflexota bacterium]